MARAGPAEERERPRLRARWGQRGTTYAGDWRTTPRAQEITLDFRGPSVSETASTFRDYRLDVTFTHAATGTKVTVPGYFAADGDAADSGATSGNVWRAQFNPPETGQWTRQASFRTGADVAVVGAPAS